MATITKRGKSYRIRAYAGYDIDGHQIERTKTWTPPAGWSEARAEKEANRLATLFEEEVKNGAGLNGNVKFAAFAERWMNDYAEPNLKPKTVARYHGLLQRINKAIGHIQIDKLRPPHLLEFYASLSSDTPANMPYSCTVKFKAYLKDRKITQAALSQKAGVSLAVLGNICRRKNISYSSAEKICAALDTPLESLFQPVMPEKTISPTTVQHYHRLISDILNDAVAWQCIPYNPCGRISAPKANPTDIEYLDDEQTKDFLKLLRTAPGHYRRAATLLLLTGLRRGELLGLEWKDINFTQKTMHIRRTAQYLPGKGVYTDTPKNKSSNRIVMISDQVVRVLLEQYQWQTLQKKLLEDDWIQSDRIVTMPNGQPMYPDRLTHWFSSFIKETDLPQIHIHSLRHTYATLCIAKGVPITAVAAQLGHANVATTAKIYAHAIKSAQIAATNAIGDLLDGLI